MVRHEQQVAEAALLGACLLNKYAPLVAAEYVAPSDFWGIQHQLIFDAIVSIVARGSNPDAVSVCAELGARIDDVGGSSYVFSLPSQCPLAANARDYAQAVRDASLDRTLRKAIAESVDSLEGESLLLALQDRLYRLDHRVNKSTNMADVWQRMKANGIKPLAPGCVYPWSKIQRLTRGMRPGWFCVLAGEASHGKTAAALEIAHQALQADKCVVLVSQEMGEEEIGIRLAQKRGFDSDRYYEGRMSADDISVLDTISMANYWSRLHLERVEKVSQLSITIRRWKPDLLIIDHLQLLAGAEKVETLSVNTRQLKLMAERFSTPILCLSQLSRAETQERGKLPRLSRLRGSGTIEQDADTVVFVWRKRDENEALTDEAALVVAKSRMGTLGAVRATFDGERQSFTPLTNEYSQEF